MSMETEKLHPLKFEPLLKRTLWGGERILSFKHLDLPHNHVGESWEISAVKGAESIVAEGELKGKTLTELLVLYKEKLVGRENYARYGDRFPLLVKFIDAGKDLSIQVHPDDELAGKRHGSFGKNEMWYVVDAQEGAGLYAGFSQEISLNEYEERVAAGSFSEVLQWYGVGRGDVFYVPFRRVHGIGKGVFVVEIQQTSDITYRIYDYLRKDETGRCRELHTELAAEAIDFADVGKDAKINYCLQKNDPVDLLATPCFSASLYDINEPMECDYSDLDSFVAYICVGGGGVLMDNGGNEIYLNQGETILFPAVVQNVMIRPGESGMKFLETYV